MAENQDPRVYFAAERTLLAWLRTGLAVIGLGFVVARFGLFLQVARGGPLTIGSEASLIGLGLVLLGTAATAGACVQHMRFSRTLMDGERPRGYWMSLSLLFGLVLALLGLSLAFFLAFESVERSGPEAPEVGVSRSVERSAP